MNDRFESAAIFKFALAMAVPVILCSFAQAEENTSDYWCQKGQSLMAEGLEGFNEASQAFDKAIQIDPQNIDAWLGKADCSGSYIGGENESIEAYHKVLNLTDESLGKNPKDAKTWQSRGLALAYLGMEDEAGIAFKKSLDILNVSLNEDPKDSQAWWLKAEDLELLGRNDIALEAYDKIIDLNYSKVIEAWIRKSDIFSGQPDGYNQSKEAFDNAIDLIVTDPEALKNDTSCKFMSFWYNEGDHIIAQNMSIENGRIAWVDFARHNLSIPAYENVIPTYPASNPRDLKNATSTEFISFCYNESDHVFTQNIWMVNDQIVRVDFVRYNLSIQAYDNLVQTYLTCNPFAAWQSKSKAIDYRQGTMLEQNEYTMGLCFDPNVRVNWVYYNFSKAYLPGNNSSSDLKEVTAEESAGTADAVIIDN